MVADIIFKNQILWWMDFMVEKTQITTKSDFWTLFHQFSSNYSNTHPNDFLLVSKWSGEVAQSNKKTFEISKTSSTISFICIFDNHFQENMHIWKSENLKIWKSENLKIWNLKISKSQNLNSTSTDFSSADVIKIQSKCLRNLFKILTRR